MNDFTRVIFALGRSIIKILISGLFGVGIGMLVFGVQTAGRPEIWEMRHVPGEFFIGIGSGLLSGGGMLVVLFLIPWLRRTPESTIMDEGPLVALPAPRPPRPERPDADEYPRPMANPPRDEPGAAGFYEK